MIDTTAAKISTFDHGLTSVQVNITKRVTTDFAVVIGTAGKDIHSKTRILCVSQTTNKEGRV